MSSAAELVKRSSMRASVRLRDFALLRDPYLPRPRGSSVHEFNTQTISDIHSLMYDDGNIYESL